jgi:hypothetical protein
VPFIYSAGGRHPDHDSINSFRKLNIPAEIARREKRLKKSAEARVEKGVHRSIMRGKRLNTTRRWRGGRRI